MHIESIIRNINRLKLNVNIVLIFLSGVSCVEIAEKICAILMFVQ